MTEKPRARLKQFRNRSLKIWKTSSINSKIPRQVQVGAAAVVVGAEEGAEDKAKGKADNLVVAVPERCSEAKPVVVDQNDKRRDNRRINLKSSRARTAECPKRKNRLKIRRWHGFINRRAAAHKSS